MEGKQGSEDLELRRRAEEMLSNSEDVLENISNREALELLHELQVHQVELEMQNENLRRNRIELEESRARYADLYEFAPVGYLTIDKNGFIREVNFTAARMLQTNKRLLLGAFFLASVREEDRPIFSEHLRDVFRTKGHWPCEVRLNVQGGGVFYAHMDTVYVEGSADLCRMSISDVTDIRHAEERTAELKKLNVTLYEQASLLDLTHDAIILRSFSNDTIAFWNRGAEKTYGWTKEEALGRISHRFLHTRFPMPLNELKKILLERGEWEGELVQTTAGGNRITVESRWALQEGAEGTPTAFLEINRDVTQRKKAEEELAAYVAKLKSLNRDLQDFAFVASHDLQEPLRKIQVFGEMLQKEHSTRLDDEGLEFLKRMQNAADRMRTLINSLLQYSRLNTRPEAFTMVDLRATALQAAEVYELQVKKKRAMVEISDLPTVEADSSQMAQLFQNLIGNALKFRGEADPVVKISSECGEAGCRISVQDNGIGFDMRYLDRIFQPFQRLHGRSEYEGTGMGLAICRKIVERHGGAITAKSEPGKGATFIINLPLRQK